MPRAKKKDPKLETVTSKPQSGLKRIPKSIDNENDSESTVDVSSQVSSGRSKRALSSKPKAWETLIPKSRDTSLVTTLSSPVPVKNSRKPPLVKPSSDKSGELDSDKEPAAKPSRSRSTTKKQVQSDNNTEVPATKTGRQARTVSGKREAVKEKSCTDEKTGRPTRRARSQKEECPDVPAETAKAASNRQSRAVSAKSKSTTATVSSRQSSRAKIKEKTVSPSPARERVKPSVPAKAACRQSSRARAADKPEAAKDSAKVIVRQSSTTRVARNIKKSVESTSENVENEVAPVKKSTKANKSKNSIANEVFLTKVSDVSKSKINQVSLVSPVEESIIKDTSDIAPHGKWKSFSKESSLYKNKRLSKELDPQSALIKSAAKKRKSSVCPEEFDPTPTKKPAVRAPSRKVGFQSIARSFAKNGEINQKNAPRKTLCNMDILGLLDDEVEEVIEENLDPVAEEEQPSKEISNENQPAQVANISNNDNSSFSKLKDKVPVWRKQLDTSKSGGSTKTFDDVFNPENYGEEEFGPEDVNPKKKRVRKKKKDTKAILVFGGNKKNAANEVKRAVKESHNLKTPEVAKKKTSRKAAVEAGKKLIQPIPNIFDNPPTSSKDQPKVPVITVAKVTYSSDFSHGAHNYFDSEIHQYDPAGDDMDNNDDHFDDGPEPSEEMNRSGAFGISLNLPSKNYKTPAIPKKISRLQTENSSTPNQKEAPKPVPVTIQEQIKCAFGFDDSEDDDALSSENESISISPVKKVTNPVLAMFDNDSVITEGGSSRLSTMSGTTGSKMSTMTGIGRLSSIQGSNFGGNISRGAQIPIIRKPAEPRKDGPFRVNFPPPRTISIEKQLQAQVRALKEKEKRKLAASKKATRFSPRKPMHSSTMNGDPIHSSTVLDFDTRELLFDPAVDIPKPKNAYEMMKEASQNPKERVKKLVKKVPKNLPALEQSSLYEDPPQDPYNLDKLSGNTPEYKQLNDKENSDTNSPQKTTKPAVSRVYKRKSVNNSTTSKPGVSFDQSMPKNTPKKVTKKEKAVNQWTQLQTSHFSEVDDFDLSFS